jgi:hypothetical protein
MPIYFRYSCLSCLRDDTLFYSPKEEYIDEIIQKLRNEEMELEVEDSVTGFLGVHMEGNENAPH